MDFTTTEQELFAGLENESPRAAMTAFVVQQVAANGNNPVASRLVDSFVHAKVPSIKYKDLLFPPTGSLDKARRHFFEMTRSSDPLVAAMAHERGFLCDFIERQCAPPHKKSNRHSPEMLETPQHAVEWIYGIFKSLSQRYKKASARQEADLMLIRAWYCDRLMIAHSRAQQRVMEAAGAHLQASVLASTSRTVIEKLPKPQKAIRDTDMSTNEVGEQVTLRALDGMLFTIPKHGKKWFGTTLDAKSCQRTLTANWSQSSSVFNRAFRVVCKNCWLGGRGCWAHTLQQCQEKGNTCHLQCPNCKSIRWISECKAKKQKKK